MFVVLTGAAGGIGRRVAGRLVDSRHDVLGLDRDREGLADLPEGVETRTVDLGDETAVSEALAGRNADAIVSAAGWYELGAIEDCSPARFRDHLETNLVAVHTVVQTLLGTLRERGGQIVVLGSTVGSVPLPYHGAYSTAKAGLHGYVDALRREVGPHGVAVSLVEPGPTPTGLNERAAAATRGRTDSPYAPQYEQFDSYRPASTDPETVAATAVRALTADSPRTRYRVGSRARWLPRLAWLLPAGLFDRIVRSGMPGGLLGRLIDR